MGKLIHFPRWRGTIVEIVDARIRFDSDDTETQGFAVDVRNHPTHGDFHVWHGLSFYLAQLEAEEVLACLPGSELQIICDQHDDDGDDDPGGGQELILANAA